MTSKLRKGPKVELGEVLANVFHGLHRNICVRASRAKPHDGFGGPFVDLKHEFDLVRLLGVIFLIDAHCINPQREWLLSSEVVKR